MSEQEHSGSPNLNTIKFPAPNLATCLEQSASCVEALEKNLYRLRQIAVKLAGDNPEPKQDLPEVDLPTPTTFIDRAKQLHSDLCTLDRDLSTEINRIESALG